MKNIAKVENFIHDDNIFVKKIKMTCRGKYGKRTKNTMVIKKGKQ